MADGTGFRVIAYDVVHDKRRERLSKLLLGYGDRVEESVFEAWLSDDEVDHLMKDVYAEIDPTEDAVRLYTICAACVRKTRVLGVGQMPRDPIVVVI